MATVVLVGVTHVGRQVGMFRWSWEKLIEFAILLALSYIVSRLGGFGA